MLPSLAVFCPQTKAFSAESLQLARSFIVDSDVLKCLLTEIGTLHHVWDILSTQNEEIASLHQVPLYTAKLIEWLTNGDAEGVAGICSGVVALPRLVIVQIVQYFHFLREQNLNHSDFMAHLKRFGGVQGYCGGLPAAAILATARNEQEVASCICTAVRLAYAIGVYAELGDDSTTPGTTTLVLRLKEEGEAEKIVPKFPHTYISAINDPRSVSIVGEKTQLAHLQDHVKRQGLLVQSVDIRGKVHNPENKALAESLITICRGHPLLDLPLAEALHVPLRSNRTTEIIDSGSLTEEIITTVLASRCEWFSLMTKVASDLGKTGEDLHSFVSFGVGDCVPLRPFNSLQLKMTRVDEGAQWLLLSQKAKTISTPDEAVAVVGAACRLPGADDLDELWNLINAGIDTHRPLPDDRFKLSDGYRALQSGDFAKNRRFFCNLTNEPEVFDNQFFNIGPREATNMDPQQRILLELAYQAMESSGYVRSHCRERGDKIGCFIGASFVEYLDNTNAHPPSAYTSTGTIRAFLCGRLSYHFGWTGPAEVIDTACSSSLVAINRAVKAVQAGECEMALTGGINIITGANNFLDLGKAGFLSPTGQCKPFDAAADGYCRAEGAGLVVLKPLKKAQQDGDQIMGVIMGSGTNQGGLSCGITVPDSQRQCALYRDVLLQSTLKASQVTYVEAHGTGTQAGDPLEIASIRNVFGSPDREIPIQIGSIKGNMGHCETAAGVAGLLKVICMLQHQGLPPQANHQSLNPKIPALDSDRMEISTRPQKWAAPFRAALVNSYGAAGSNAALICSEPPFVKQLNSGVRQPMILSARTELSLRKLAKRFASYLGTQAGQTSLVNVACTLSQARQRHEKFTVVQAGTVAEAQKMLSQPESLDILTRPGTQHTCVLVFGGQSKRFIGLDKSLYDNFETFRKHLDQCSGIVESLGHPSIIPAIFGQNEIHDIVVLQAGFVAVQYSMAQMWLAAGYKPDRLIGHSLGELTCLAVSEVLSISDCLRLVTARAEAMKTKWEAEKGAMLAVFATSEKVLEAIEHVDGKKLEIACYNSETCQVVSGDSLAVENLRQHLLSAGKKFQNVNTSHAFHSRLVEPIASDLDSVSLTLKWNPARIPVERCTIQGEGDFDNRYPMDHARQPVYFFNAVQRIEQRYPGCLWLEAGFDTPIISMTKRAIKDTQRHVFIPFSPTASIDAANQLASIVNQLWQVPVDVSHWSWLQTDGSRQVWLPPYQFDGKNAWLPNIDRAAELEVQLEATDQSSAQSSLLVRQLPKSSEKYHTFMIDSQCERFQKIVAGHAVRQRPLCPASVYMECVCMAFQLLSGRDAPYLHLDKFEIMKPLGACSHDLRVSLTEGDGSYSFEVFSSNPGKPESLIKHAKGLLRTSTDSDWDLVENLTASHIKGFMARDDIESLAKKRAYDFFSRVVSYDGFLKGINRISMSGNEATAELTIPTEQPGIRETSAAKFCDAVTLDNSIQILGLLLNTSEMVGHDEVMVCTGHRAATLDSSADMIEHKHWKAVCTFEQLSSSQAEGNLILLSAEQKIAATVTGCRFSKLKIKDLERLLDSAKPKSVNGTEAVNRNEAVKPAKALQPEPARRSVQATDTSIRVKHLLEAHTGVPAADIKESTVLMDLGLDSLAAVELAEDLKTRYNSTAESSDLLSLSVQQLCQQLDIPGAANFDEDIGQEPADQQPVASNPVVDPEASSRVFDLLTELTGIPRASILNSLTLEELGIDSLAMSELISALSDSSRTDLSDEVLTSTTVKELLEMLDPSSALSQPSSVPSTTPLMSQDGDSKSCTEVSSENEDLDDAEPAKDPGRVDFDLAAGLANAHMKGTEAAPSYGFVNFWDEVNSKQNEVVAAYILEAYQSFGIDLKSLSPGASVPEIPGLDKYSRLRERILNILEELGLVSSCSSGFVRGASQFSPLSSAELVLNFKRDFPAFKVEADLLALTGPHLAACLSGQKDAIKLLFGSGEKLLEQYYSGSPGLAVLTDQLVAFVEAAVKPFAVSGTPVRIIEVGAGTGATTRRLVEQLNSSKVRFEYTFTDISRSLVGKARGRFSDCKQMRFEVLDLEKQCPPHLQGQFDLIIGTNCVHATKSRSATMSRARTLLGGNGCILLAEVTHVINWYDLVFGLLDGWWLSPDYPLQPSHKWLGEMRTAGFLTSTCTHGSRDLNTQQLLVGCQKRGTMDRMTVEYKNAGVPIHADIYMPSASTQPLPVALLLHGGGYMTLSRKAIRPSQTEHLVNNGFIAISIDYRLCPGVSVPDGAMTDVCDALTWIREALPSIVAVNNLRVDTDKIAVVGYSSGGHLALSTAWTTKARGDPPPKAILCFYAPTDFTSGDTFRNLRDYSLPQKLSRDHILSLPASELATSHTVATGADPETSWMKSGDPRSEILQAFFREPQSFGLSVLLNGPKATVKDLLYEPSPENVQAICPTWQVRHGTYDVPTFFVHGTDDEVAPYDSALGLQSQMSQRGVRCEMLTVEGGKHLHDLRLKPGMPEWDRFVLPAFNFLFDVLRGQ